MLPGRSQLTPDEQRVQAADDHLRLLLNNNDDSALDQRIAATTIFNNIRARCRCNVCDSESVMSAPENWSSLIGLTGECYSCEEEVRFIRIVFLDRERNVILVVFPDVEREQLLQGLCYLEQYSRNPQLNPSGSAFTMVRTTAGGSVTRNEHGDNIIICTR
jgi:hypothetical protein